MRWSWAASALLLVATVAIAAEPYTPQDAATVLLKRPAGVAKALRDSRATVVSADPAARAAAASAAIAAARQSGDPRYYGQAQALLGSDWTAAEPTPVMRLLRATLLQQRHDFVSALVDLDAVLAANPRNAQARLTRANIRMVQGDPVQAKRDCAGLIGQASLLVVATCVGSATALNGQAATGLQAIELALLREPDSVPTLRIWALTQAAEIAERMGNTAAATEHFVLALAEANAAGENDVYLQAAYADFLLDQHRAAEVQSLLAKASDFDPLLLRLALAEQQLADAGDAAAAGRVAFHLKELLDRFALAATRGDAAHRREQAMTALYLQRDPAAALQLAQQNWAEQHEPADARLLLQAALTSQQVSAAQPVLDWLAQTQLEDVRIAPLVAQLKDKP